MGAIRLPEYLICFGDPRRLASMRTSGMDWQEKLGQSEFFASA